MEKSQTQVLTLMRLSAMVLQFKVELFAEKIVKVEILLLLMPHLSHLVLRLLVES